MNFENGRIEEGRTTGVGDWLEVQGDVDCQNDRSLQWERKWS
jgi:hypothetical protein